LRFNCWLTATNNVKTLFGCFPCFPRITSQPLLPPWAPKSSQRGTLGAAMAAQIALVFCSASPRTTAPSPSRLPIDALFPHLYLHLPSPSSSAGGQGDTWAGAIDPLSREERAAAATRAGGDTLPRTRTIGRGRKRASRLGAEEFSRASSNSSTFAAILPKVSSSFALAAIQDA
jgi:hypothetical protein